MGHHLLDPASHEHSSPSQAWQPAVSKLLPAYLFLTSTRLAVPGSDPVIVVHFPVVDPAQETFRQTGPDHGEMLAETAFEADTDPDAGVFDGPLHGCKILDRQTEGFLDDEMLAGLGRRDGLLGMQMVRRADVHDVDFRSASISS